MQVGKYVSKTYRSENTKRNNANRQKTSRKILIKTKQTGNTSRINTNLKIPIEKSVNTHRTIIFGKYISENKNIEIQVEQIQTGTYNSENTNRQIQT